MKDGCVLESTESIGVQERKKSTVLDSEYECLDS